MIAPPHVPLIKQWRRQVPRRRRDIQHRRPLGVLGYLTNGPTLDGMMEVEKVVLVVLYDEPVHVGPLCLRLAGFSGRPVPWGVCWGGRAGSKFFKDLRLQPAPQAQGRRMNADDTELLQLGLQLERQLQRHLRNRWLPINRQPELPPVWAGFRRPDARDIQGDGPELAAACRPEGKTTVQTTGFAGPSCQDAGRFLEEGLRRMGLRGLGQVVWPTARASALTAFLALASL